MSVKRFPCQQCGAQLSFEPGTVNLKCDYCGFANHIPQSEEEIEELDFHEYANKAMEEAVDDGQQTVKCSACAAEFTAPAKAVSDICAFCGSNVIIPVPAEARIHPKSLLPFKLKSNEAREAYKKWLQKLWLAPNTLKRFALSEGGLTGMYVPYWTFDSDTTSWYTGMRGEHYWVTETYRDSNGNTQTRQVRKTRWYPASGVVWNSFDDLLVLGSHHIPPKHGRAMKNWDLDQLVPYSDEFLSGFRTQRYEIELESGFEEAKTMMLPQIHSSIRLDIGGDEQQITSVKTQYDNITFKHILLPIWLGSYRYRQKSYTFLVNGRTGEVAGDAPISWWKVAGLVLLAVVVIGLILFLASR
jgi:DNA-directed RNA polymerase subunit RPC12/RpoP